MNDQNNNSEMEDMDTGQMNSQGMGDGRQMGGHENTGQDTGTQRDLGDDPVTKTEIKQVLEDASFPCGKQELVSHAEQNGADESEIDLLQTLPDMEYTSIEDVDQALGQPER